MEFIIDGYNVIKFSDLFNAMSLEGSRDKLIDFILKYNPQGRNSITVVFDCKSKNPYEVDGYTVSAIRGIKVIFSEGQSSADDVIVNFVEKAEKPYNIVVVSNDKGIYRRIGDKGAKKMSVADFIYKRFKENTVFSNTAKIKRKDDFYQISRELSDLWLSGNKKKSEDEQKKSGDFDITSELSDLWLKK